LLRDPDGKSIISRDVISGEGIGGDGVVEVGSDPTGNSQTAECHSAQIHTEVQEGLKVESLREVTRPRPLSQTGQKRASLKLCARPGQSLKRLRRILGCKHWLLKGTPRVRDAHRGSGIALTLRRNRRQGSTPKDGEASRSAYLSVGGEESELWRKSMDEEMRPLLEKHNLGAF
ncbi:hypothetical protein KFL_013160010, partial [Klebsormidium nitens]